VGDFRLPWHRSAGNILRPVNVASKKAYRGINVVALWAYAEEFGYSSGVRLDIATVLFLPLFLFWRSRNFRERGSGRGDLWLLLSRLLGFAVAPNLTFCHRNSPLRRLAWLRALRHPVGGRFSSKSANKIKQLGLINPISPHRHDVALYRNLFPS
jgi:hypothetical protein